MSALVVAEIMWPFEVWTVALRRTVPLIVSMTLTFMRMYEVGVVDGSQGLKNRSIIRVIPSF